MGGSEAAHWAVGGEGAVLGCDGDSVVFRLVSRLARSVEAAGRAGEGVAVRLGPAPVDCDLD